MAAESFAGGDVKGWEIVYEGALRADEAVLRQWITRQSKHLKGGTRFHVRQVSDILNWKEKHTWLRIRVCVNGKMPGINKRIACLSNML